LTEILREAGAVTLHKLLKIEANRFVVAHIQERLEDGSQRVVLNGYAKKRKVLLPVGLVEVEQPRVRDRKVTAEEGEKIRFTSQMLPRYLRRVSDITEMIPWLYLKGLSVAQFSDVFDGLYGQGAKGISPATVSSLLTVWEEEFANWQTRDLTGQQYVYIWADGVFFNVRAEKDNHCIMVLVGVNKD
jgi:transposase-like protein